MTKSTIYDFRHTGLVVRNLTKELNFYKDVLGFKIVVDTNEDSKFIQSILGVGKPNLRTIKMSTRKDGSGGLLELLYFSSTTKKHHKMKPESLGFTHIALSVEKIDALYKRMLKNKTRFISPPTTSPTKIAKVAFCFDPEGNMLELVEILKR